MLSTHHIIWLLTLHNLPSLLAEAATKNDYVLLAVHDQRCVTSPLLAQGMEVLPAVLSFLPRYARCLRVHPTARHKGVVDHREGVLRSPWRGKRWDRAVCICGEDFNVGLSSISSGDYYTCVVS